MAEWPPFLFSQAHSIWVDWQLGRQLAICSPMLQVQVSKAEPLGENAAKEVLSLAQFVSLVFFFFMVIFFSFWIREGGGEWFDLPDAEGHVAVVVDEAVVEVKTRAKVDGFAVRGAVGSDGLLAAGVPLEGALVAEVEEASGDVELVDWGGGVGASGSSDAAGNSSNKLEADLERHCIDWLV